MKSSKPFTTKLKKPTNPETKAPKTYKEHKEKWKNCENCTLCHQRQHVVFARGTLPCDVLFIGEAPGFSEDVIGRPMVGPAGKLMDHMIEMALSQAGEEISWAITNLVSCIPKEEDSNNKTEEPSEESIHACSEKLYEFIRIAKPKAIIFVGKLAANYVSPIEIKLRPNEPPISEDALYTSIDHPAYLLRMDVSGRDLFIQRNITKIKDIFEELSIPF